MILLLLVFPFLINTADPASILNAIEDEFATFTKRFNKNYTSSTERDYRRGIFAETKNFIEAENLAVLREIESRFEKSEKPLQLEINEFSDLTYDEFHQGYLMTELPTLDPTKLEGFASSKNTVRQKKRLLAGEKKVDWTWIPTLRTILNQGKCGSCWAFAAMQTLYAWVYMKHKQRVKLSIQELVDCAPWSNGCQGGFQAAAFNYIKVSGVYPSQRYPYVGQKQQCRNGAVRLLPLERQDGFEKDIGHEKTESFRSPRRGRYDSWLFRRSVLAARYLNGKNFFNQKGKFFQLRGFGIAPTNLYGFLDRLRKGPIASAIFIDRKLMSYKTGVHDGSGGCSNSIPANHAIVAVGFSLSAQPPYIRYLNSWGIQWGQRGYFMMGMGDLRTGQGICSTMLAPVNAFPLLHGF